MTRIADVATTQVVVIQPHESVERAAQMMCRMEVGALPVYDGEHLVGMVTDRDITVRAVAMGKPVADTPVSEIMSRDTLCCGLNDDVEEVERRMGEAQVRRVPVLDRSHDLVGIVSLGDLATRQNGHVDEVLREISTPSQSETAH
jgi:CBS domain-containing protein